MNERIALYSTSLYDAAKEENCTEEVYESLKAISGILDENGDYVKLVSSSWLKSEEREALIDEAFGGRCHIFALNFMKILAKKRIFDIFIPCVNEYEKKYYRDNNIENATIITAIPLDTEKQSEIISKIGKATGKTVKAKFEVKKEIIGGIIIETENSGIDASVESKLKSIERYISKN